MAASGTYMFDDGKLVIAGVDLSNRARSIKVARGNKAQNDLAMGARTESNRGGLLTWQLTLMLEQDFNAGETDATIFPLLLPGVTSSIVARPTSAVASATNPELGGTGVVTEYNIIDGSIGDLMLCSVTIESASPLTHT